jgi:hypothetical protein
MDCQTGNEELSTHPIDHFFSFGVGKGSVGKKNLICSQCVPIKFQRGSQHALEVPNVFLNMFPIAPHFVPYVVAQTLSFLEPIKMNKYWHIYVSIVV